MLFCVGLEEKRLICMQMFTLYLTIITISNLSTVVTGFYHYNMIISACDHISDAQGPLWLGKGGVLPPFLNWFLAPLAKGQRGLCHGPVSVVCASVRWLFLLTSSPKQLVKIWWNFSGMFLWWTSLKFVQIMPLGSNLTLPRGVKKLKICLYKAYFVQTLKIFLSITIGPRATKFGM